MKQLQEKLLALLLMALLTGTGAYAQEASDKQKTPDYRFAVRTNVLYDAFLLPTLGVEWRMNENVGIKLDGSLAWWGGNHGAVVSAARETLLCRSIGNLRRVQYI